MKHIDHWFRNAFPEKKHRAKVIDQWKKFKKQKSRRTATAEFPTFCKDQKKKIIEYHLSVLKDQKLTLITLNDITSRKAAEDTAQKNRNTINSIFKAAPTGIGMVKNRVIVKVNDALCNMLGYSQEELLNQSSRILYPTDEDYVFVGNEKYRQITAQGTGTVETKWRCRDGQILNILLSSTPVNLNDWSQGVTFTALDITERIKAQEATKKSEARYRQFFEEIMSGAFISTPEGRLLDCNQEFVKIFGFSSRQEALECDIPSLYEQPSYRLKFLNKIKEQNGVRHFQSKMVKKDGSALVILENAFGVFDEKQQLTSIRGYLSDITELVSMENQLRQAQKMEAIGTLVSGISHDFNNLLQAIIGYAELLCLKKEKTDPEYSSVQSLRRISRRAGNLVKQLLIFSRDAQTQKKIIEINNEVLLAKNLLEKMIPRMIAIHLDMAEKLWLVEADPLQIEQVILNLGSNASDAMPDGGEIRIVTQNITADKNFEGPPGTSPGKYVLLQVSDTGHGMTPQVREKIFDPFFTTKKTGKGTGLGLSSVYGIIKNHDGFIDCISRPSRGTVFKIYLPAVKGKSRKSEKKAEKKFKKGNEAILVVDDEETIRDVTSNVFQRMGYTCFEAPDGETALDLYRRQASRIDLVILDLSMPGMGGFKCLKELIAMDPDVKILMASGYSADTTVEDCVAEGAVDYIRKPYLLSELFEKVRQILDLPD